MAIENFSGDPTWIETDQYGEISTDTTGVEFTDLQRKSVSWVRKDYGADYFDLTKDLTHKYQFQITAESDYCQCALWSLSNQDECSQISWDNRDAVIRAWINPNNVAYFGWLRDADTHWDWDTVTYSLAYLYYVTVEWLPAGGVNGTGKINWYVCRNAYWGDSGSIWVDTATSDIMADVTMPDMQWLSILSGAMSASSTYEISGYVQNLEVIEQEGDAEPEGGPFGRNRSMDTIFRGRRF